MNECITQRKIALWTEPILNIVTLQYNHHDYRSHVLKSTPAFCPLVFFFISVHQALSSRA